MSSRNFLSITTAVALVCSSTVRAQDQIPLTVVFAGGEKKNLSLEDLDAMKQVSFSTSTIWTDGVNQFSGVPVASLLQYLDAEVRQLKLSALNDYSVEIPVAELEAEVPIIATRVDGSTMSVREKGPYWVMFPFDDRPDYKTESNYSRAIWQLQTIELLE